MATIADMADKSSATRSLKPLRISEVILKTARFDEMKHWYTLVIGIPPFFERKPDPAAAKLQELGRATDRRICFTRLALDYPYAQVLGLFEVPEVQGKPATEPGLDHLQLRNADMAQLVARYDALKEIGIKPYRTANHGPGTSFYYNDPDGNRVELSAANFATEAEYLAYFQSESYRRNPSGIEVDVEDYVGRFRSGMPLSELVHIPL